MHGATVHAVGSLQLTMLRILQGISTLHYVSMSLVSLPKSLACPQALLGWLLFGESLNVVWWCGASLVVTGVAVMWDSQRDRRGIEKQKGKEE